MRIEVIGYKGVVGSVTYELFRHLGYTVTGSDKGDEINKADIYFICVPEDTVKSIIDWLAKHWQKYCGLIVIKSSVPPQTCDMFSKIYPFMHICHNPEFLREALALQDELNPARIVIGQCCYAHGDLLESLYKPLRRPIVRTDPTTSELVKLASNVHLSCLISYWNTIEEIAKKIGVSGHQIGMIASLDPRISPYGARFHNKYGGRCLPKDTKHLIEFAERVGYDPVLLKSIEAVNERL